jgi:TetR/AcrR family transcriptional regulator, transcriptional repressor for nem operon
MQGLFLVADERASLQDDLHCASLVARRTQSDPVEQKTMRKSKAETAKTRGRIVKAAGAEFAANGISEAGLARVMAAAGLTHGGFYRHFASKDQLVLEACSQTLLSVVAGLELLVNGEPHEQALRLLVDRYVSRAHRDRPKTGCPLAALGSELARKDKKTRDTATEGFLRLSRLIAGQLENVPFRVREARSMAIVAAMVGAVTLARIVPDKRISDSVLAGTREYIVQTVRPAAAGPGFTGRGRRKG